MAPADMSRASEDSSLPLGGLRVSRLRQPPLGPGSLCPTGEG
jgi:hypothetical protein